MAFACPLCGDVGLLPASLPGPFTPAVEGGGGLEHAGWGQGYATEGAQAAVADSKGLRRKRPRVSARLSRTGRAAFVGHVAALQQIVERTGASVKAS